MKKVNKNICYKLKRSSCAKGTIAPSLQRSSNNNGIKQSNRDKADCSSTNCFLTIKNTKSELTITKPVMQVATYSKEKVFEIKISTFILHMHIPCCPEKKLNLTLGAVLSFLHNLPLRIKIST